MNVWVWSTAVVMAVVLFIMSAGGLGVLVVRMGDRVLEWIETRLQQGEWMK